MLDGLQANKSECMPTVQFFFEGIRLMFTDNGPHHTGHAKNNTCIGQHIILDEREPPDPGSAVWMLKYPPLGVIVKPDIVHVGTSVLPDHPDCIMVVPVPVVFSLKLPSNSALHPKGSKLQSISIHRSGMPLDTADVFTDFWTQGMSFLTALFLLDLTPPPTGAHDGKMHGASIRVPLSRYSRFSDIKLFRPLWTKPSQKDKVVERLWQALKPNKDIVAEVHRLEALEQSTLLRHDGLLARHGL